MPRVDTHTADAARIALAEAHTAKCLVELYTGSEDSFSVGYVDALSKAHVRLRSVDQAGQPDGIEVRSLADVSRVETGTDYLVRRMANLVGNRWRAPDDQRLTGEDPNLVRDALTLSLADRTVVTIWTSGNSDTQYTGVVAKLGQEAGSMLDLDEYGDVDREVAFRFDAIHSLDFGCLHQRIVQRLHRS